MAQRGVIQKTIQLKTNDQVLLELNGLADHLMSHSKFAWYITSWLSVFFIVENIFKQNTNLHFNNTSLNLLTVAAHDARVRFELVTTMARNRWLVCPFKSTRI